MTRLNESMMIGTCIVTGVCITTALNRAWSTGTMGSEIWPKLVVEAISVNSRAAPILFRKASLPFCVMRWLPTLVSLSQVPHQCQVDAVLLLAARICYT